MRGQVQEHLRRYARRLRRDQTDAERKLWSRLRDRRLYGARFRRQHPIGPFIADFCCTTAKLIVELDGGQHALQKRSDAERTAFLAGQGYRLIRFWDNEALTNTEGVLLRIIEALGVKCIVGNFVDEGDVVRHNTTRLAKELHCIVLNRP